MKRRQLHKDDRGFGGAIDAIFTVIVAIILIAVLMNIFSVLYKVEQPAQAQDIILIASEYATSGSGAVDAPWIGWDSAVEDLPTNGGMIFMPVGHYEPGIIDKNNVTLLGGGRNTIIKIPDNDVNKRNGLWLDGDNITVDNICIDGNAKNNPDYGEFDVMDELNAIMYTGHDYCKILNSWIYNFAGHGIFSLDSGDNAIICGNHVYYGEDFNYGGINIGRSKNCIVDSNILIESHITAHTSNNTIYSNNFIENSRLGIHMLDNTTYSLVQGNTFTNCNTSIYADHITECIIDGNTISYSYDAGIHLYLSTNITISDNLIGDSGLPGIWFGGVTDSSIINNRIYRSGLRDIANRDAGIWFDTHSDEMCSNNSVIGNIIDGGMYGIGERQYSTDYNIYRGNTIRNADTNRIYCPSTHTIIEDNWGFNPIGHTYMVWDNTSYVLTPRYLLGMGTSGLSQTFESDTWYTLENIPALIVSAGGTGVTIQINDATGFQPYTSTLGSTCHIDLEVGWKIKFTYTTIPTVIVYFK